MAWRWSFVVAVVDRRGRVGRRRRRRRPTAHETGAVTVDGTPLPQYTADEVDTAIGDPIPTLTGVSFDGSHGHDRADRQAASGDVPRALVSALSGGGAAHRRPREGGSVQGDRRRRGGHRHERRSPELPAVRVVGARELAVPGHGRQHRAAPRRRRTGSPRTPTSCSSTQRGRSSARATGEIAPSDLQKILTALEAGNPLPKGSGASSAA